MEIKQNTIYLFPIDDSESSIVFVFKFLAAVESGKHRVKIFLSFKEDELNIYKNNIQDIDLSDYIEKLKINNQIIISKIFESGEIKIN